jgi:hypothetical protein
VPHRLASRRDRQKPQVVDSGQLVEIAHGDPAALRSPLVDVPQLPEQHSGLEGVESQRPADRILHVFRTPAVLPEHPDPVGKVSVVGDDGSRVNERSEIPAGIKAERRCVRERASSEAVTPCAWRASSMIASASWSATARSARRFANCP